MDLKHPTRMLSVLGKSPPRELDVGGCNAAIDYEQASIDSFDSAARAVAEMLTKPESLDSLDQIRAKVARKKVTVESQLRNAVQTQLDGVQNGLELLKDSFHTIKDIKESMTQVELVYKQCEELADIIGPIREVNRRFQQLRITNVHINNIFRVLEVEKEIQLNIDNGELLQAHQNLCEMELTRNDLLIQLYQSSDAFVNKNTAVHRYFEPITQLSDRIGNQLWEIIENVTDRVNDNPAKVVSALRIIQREEKADRSIADALEQKYIPISQIPNRPKRWREKCVEKLDRSILAKFEKLDPGDMKENKDWLSDYLTDVATICYQDLQSIKENGVHCFPPDYDILDFFIKRYQISLKKVVADLVANDLNARDIIKLMIWIGDVRQSFRDSLGVDLEEHGPLIDQTLEKDLQATCVDQVKWNVSEVVSKMLENEKEDWVSHEIPNEDNFGCFYTTIGLLLYEMVDQNLSAMTMFGKETKEMVLQSCLNAIKEFQSKYRNEICKQFDVHISSGREDPPLFFLYMIAIANNCKSCIEFTEQLKERFLSEFSYEVQKDTMSLFEEIKDEFDVLGLECCEKVVRIVFEDLDPLIDGLLTKERWLQKPLDLLNKIEGTLMDYNQDLEKLKNAYHSSTIVMAQRRMFKCYIQAMMKKKIVLKKKEERQKAASFVKEEAMKLGNLFQRLSHATSPAYTQVLIDLSELLHSNSENMPYVIGGFMSRSADLRYNHVVAVLAMRGDLKKAECQKLLDRTALKANQQQSDDGEEDNAHHDYKYKSSAMRARKKEKSLLTEIDIPNPFSLY